MNGHDKEALRQQMMLRALLGDARPGVLAGWLREGAADARFGRGLAAYRAHAGASAERALAAAYPTVQQLLGAASFAALARAHWQRDPPQVGDLGLWGGELAAFIADAESLASEPYLPDVARLEWAVHQAERAADAAAPQGLQKVADADPGALRLRLTPGTAVIDSAHPIVAIWQAHRSDAADRYAPVRAAFAAGGGECALVFRSGWRAAVRSVPADEARLLQALLAGHHVAAALDAAGPDFDFQHWLLATLQRQGLSAAEAGARDKAAQA